MKMFLSLIALFGVIAIADVAVSPSANATTLTTSIQALNTQHAGAVQQARMSCWWRNGRRHCRWIGPPRRNCWWRNGRRICRW